MKVESETLIAKLGTTIPSIAKALGEMDTRNSYVELATAMTVAKETIDALSRAQKELTEKYDLLREKVIPEKMEAEQLSTVTLPALGRLTVGARLRVSTKADCKHELKQWFRDNGYADLVTETINSSTLAAWYKEQLEAGNDVPEDLLNVYAFQQASLTKK